MDLRKVLPDLRAFVAEREWARFHDPKNLAMAIASEAGELLALFRWVKGEDADAFVREPARRGDVEDEAADVAITLLLFCERAGIDLAAAIRRKMRKNRDNYPVAASKGTAERPPRASAARKRSPRQR